MEKDKSRQPYKATQRADIYKMRDKNEKPIEPASQRDWNFLKQSLKGLGFVVVLTLLFEFLSILGSFFGVLGYLFFILCILFMIAASTFLGQKNKPLSNRDKWLLFGKNGAKAAFYMAVVSFLMWAFGLWGGVLGLVLLEVALALFFFWQRRSQVLEGVEQLQVALYGKRFKDYTKEEWESGQVKMIWRKQLKAAREQKNNKKTGGMKTWED